jgi:hypothetical protein
MDISAIGRALEAVQREAQTVLFTLRAKGLNRFGRVLVILLAVNAGTYFFVYLPPQNKLARVKRNIAEAKVSSQSADAYRIVRDKLRASYQACPKLKVKDGFIATAFRETLRAEGLTADVKVPDESAEMDVAMQSMTQNLPMTFAEALSWLARVEATTPHLHISEFMLAKDTSRPGTCNVQIGMTTAFPSEELAP